MLAVGDIGLDAAVPGEAAGPRAPIDGTDLVLYGAGRLKTAGEKARK
jgi:hypothetical protein